VIVLDANILLYAYDSLSPHHSKARAWIEQVFSGTELVGLPWQAISAFLRVSTNPRLPGQRFSSEEAANIVDRWLEQPNVRVLSPRDDHWKFLRQMVREGQASGQLVTDADLAALTVEHGGKLHTFDRDFARFPSLQWTNL
jgi:toxin-antitoxin system PIN domain toxin